MMNKRIVLGLVGFIGCGKGSSGTILTNDFDFVQESFARPLKDAVSMIFNWDRLMLEGDTEESRKWREQEDSYWTKQLGRSITPRLVLQLMGTEAGRQVFGKNLWTASLLNRLDPNTNYVITDCRFANEIEALRSIGAKIVRIRRGVDPIWLDTARTCLRLQPSEYLDQLLKHLPHRSEWDWCGSKIDYEIYNIGTMVHLKQEIESLLTRIDNLS